MPATPARIALSLNDGVVLSKADSVLKTNHQNAVDGPEVESFFDTETDAQVLLDERWAWVSAVGRLRDQIEIDSSFDLGTTFPIAPTIPTMTISDETRGIVASVPMVRSYAVDYNSERYAVDLVA